MVHQLGLVDVAVGLVKHTASVAATVAMTVSLTV